MKELLAPHWLLGGSLSIGGGLAYRLGGHLVSGQSLVAVKIVGLVCLTLGLFIIMRGVSRVASSRPPLEGKEAERHIPQLRRRRPPTEPK